LSTSIAVKTLSKSLSLFKRGNCFYQLFGEDLLNLLNSNPSPLYATPSPPQGLSYVEKIKIEKPQKEKLIVKLNLEALES
jgi:hypothetical protein